MTPMPPSRAMAMAMRASVTLSMAAETSGTASSMSAANRAVVSTVSGSTRAVAGDDDDVVEGEGLESIEQLVVAHALISFGAGAVPHTRGEGGDDQVVFGGVDALGRASRACRRCRSAPSVVASTGPASTPSSGTRCTMTPVDGALAALELGEGSLDGVGAGQLAGQCGVQVDDHAGEPAEEAHRQDAHPAEQHDVVGLRSR